MMVGAPGVRQAFNIALSARGRGHVVVSYLGSGSTAADTEFSGYITESDDVLQRQPTFWSAAVSPPGAPLYPGGHHETFGDRLFFIGNTIGPDGTPWAAFHCLCHGRRLGIAAHLERPR